MATINKGWAVAQIAILIVSVSGAGFMPVAHADSSHHTDHEQSGGNHDQDNEGNQNHDQNHDGGQSHDNDQNHDSDTHGGDDHNDNSCGDDNTPPPPTDACPNIDGVQTSVPDGLVLNSDGQCVAPAPVDPTCVGDQQLVDHACVDPTCSDTQHLDTETHTCVDNSPTPVLGCTDATATNYNPAATQSDGSCTYSQPETPPITTTTTSGGHGHSHGSNAPKGEVLGASCGIYMDKHVKFGSPKNDPEQVTKLQSFLNKWVGATLPLTGIYDEATLAAVEAFQSKYSVDILSPWGISAPTGLVYLSTIRVINLLECPALTLPTPELIPWNENPYAQ